MRASMLGLLAPGLPLTELAESAAADADDAACCEASLAAAAVGMRGSSSPFISESRREEFFKK